MKNTRTATSAAKQRKESVPFPRAGERRLQSRLGNLHKLPAARQRRLTRLLDKAGEQSLSVSERRELAAILSDVDRRSFWRVAELVANQVRSHPRRAAS